MSDTRVTPGIPDPALSFAVLAAGLSLGRPLLAAAGLLGLGLSILANGLLAVRERRLMFIRGGTLTRREYRYFIYEGLAAVPYGLALAIAGTLLATPAVLFLAGVEPNAVRSAVLAGPHLLLLPGGAGLLLHGLGFCIGFGREAQSPRDRIAIALLHLPALLGGLILVALGTTLLAIGLTEWLAPAVFRARFESFFGNPWPFG